MNDNVEAPKPGWKTSEFWLHLLAYAPGLVGMFLGQQHPLVLALGVVASVAGHSAAGSYSEQRKDLKQNPPVPRGVPLRDLLPPPGSQPAFTPPTPAEMVKSTIASVAEAVQHVMNDPEASAQLGALLASFKTLAKKHGLEDEEDPAPGDVAAADPAPAPAAAPAPAPTPAAQAVAAAARGAMKTYGPGSHVA